MNLQHRYMDGIETQVQNTPNIYLIEYEGKVEKETLEHSFRVLCSKYPVLVARTCYDDKARRYLLFVSGESTPDLVVKHGGEAAYLAEAQSYWDAELSVCRLIFVSNENGGYVALRIDHAIADGRGGLTFLNELWRLYSALSAGVEDIAESSGRLPDRPYDLLVRRFGYLGSDPSGERYAEITFGQHPAHQGSLRFSKQHTKRLIDHARTHGSSVHGIVCSAILLAQRTLGGEPRTSSPMTCWTPIDLRGRVDPPVGRFETTNFLAFHRVQMSIEKDVSLTSIGRRITKDIELSLERRYLTLTAAVVPSKPLATPVDPRLANALVTNLGPIPTFTEVAGAKIVDVRSTMFVPVLIPTYVVHTYEGKLTVEFHMPFTAFEIGELDGLIKEATKQFSSILFDEEINSRSDMTQ